MHWLAMLLASLLITWPAWGAPKKKAAEPPKVEQTESPKPACLGIPLEPLLERVKSSGLEYEIIADHQSVLRISMVLAQNVDGPFAVPDQIIVVFLREESRIGLITDGKLCAMLSGPVAQVRAMVYAIHGRSVDI